MTSYCLHNYQLQENSQTKDLWKYSYDVASSKIFLHSLLKIIKGTCWLQRTSGDLWSFYCRWKRIFGMASPFSTFLHLKSCLLGGKVGIWSHFSVVNRLGIFLYIGMNYKWPFPALTSSPALFINLFKKESLQTEFSLDCPFSPKKVGLKAFASPSKWTINPVGSHCNIYD